MPFTIHYGKADYKPFVPKKDEGKGSQLLPFGLGPVKVVAKKIEEGQSSAGNNKLVVTFVVDDEPHNGEDIAGKRIVYHMAVTGTRSDGIDNAVNLKGMYNSMFTSEMSVEDAQRTVDAMTEDGSSKDAIEALTGKTFWIKTDVRTFPGDDGEAVWVSEFKDFIPRQEYVALRAAPGGGRRSLPAAALAYKNGATRKGSTDANETDAVASEATTVI